MPSGGLPVLRSGSSRDFRDFRVRTAADRAPSAALAAAPRATANACGRRGPFERRRDARHGPARPNGPAWPWLGRAPSKPGPARPLAFVLCVCGRACPTARPKEATRLDLAA